MIQHILTLISTEKPIEDALVQAVYTVAHGAVVHILKPGEAISIQLHQLPEMAVIRSLCEPERVDVIVQPSQYQRKKLLICDMDSTMITVECIDELADFVGKKQQVARITDRAMNGELDFAAALTERVALLKGLPEADLQACYDSRVTMSPGAKELVSAMRQAGGHCVLVSGGFDFFTSRVRTELGFDEDYSNRLEVADGKLTGRVIPPILGKEMKLQVLQEQVARLKIHVEEVLALGDGANDLPMLLAAGLGVAYRAKPNVRAQALHHLNFASLDALKFVM